MARPQARTAAPPRRISLLPALVALVVTFIAFAPSLSNGFVNWDDNINIYENKNIEALDSAHVKAIFGETVIGGYNPLTILTFAVERHFAGLNPKLYHVDNLILHLVCVLLVFVFLRQLKVNAWGAVFGAVLFGIHPMRVESVAWATERKDVLYAAFYLGALVAYVRYVQSNLAVKYYLIALGLFAFALFAKIQAVALPLSFLALDYYFNRSNRRKEALNSNGKPQSNNQSLFTSAATKLLIEKIPFFAMSLAVGSIGILLLSKSETLKDNSGFGLFQHMLLGAYSFCVYLIKLVVPYVLCAVYPYPAKLSPEFYVAPLGVLALLAAGWWAHKRGNRAVVFGIAFFIVNIVFVLQILGAGQGFVADRFTYVAYLGLFFIVAQIFEKFLADKQWSGSAQAAAAICVVVFAVMTWKQCAVWKDGETLWTSVMRQYPTDPLAYGQRGFHYRTIASHSNGDTAQRYYNLALTDYNRAAQILDAAPGKFTKDKVTVHNSRGKTLFDMGRTPEAIADYTKAIESDPTFAEAYINRGAAYGKSGKNDLALADFNKGIELDPKAANGYFNRSLLYSDMKKLDLAIKDHDSYLQLNPGNIPILYERAVAKRALGRPMEAIADFNECLRLDPNQPDIFLERSRAYKDLGKKDEALRDAKMAKANGIKVDDIYLQQLQQ